MKPSLMIAMSKYLISGFSTFTLETVLFIIISTYTPIVAVSNSLSFFGAALFNALLVRRWVFGGRSIGHVGYVKLVALYILNFTASNAVTLFFVTKGLPGIYSKILSISIVVLLNFTLLNKVIYGQAKIYKI